MIKLIYYGTQYMLCLPTCESRKSTGRLSTMVRGVPINVFTQVFLLTFHKAIRNMMLSNK
jgi:hypothetical protein